MEFYPQEDSVLIIATDGLIDSLGTTKNEFENEKDILKTYFDAQSSNKPNDIAREMGRMADKQSGVDNITLIILSNKQEILQPVLQPDLQPVKKMKKLS